MDTYVVGITNIFVRLFHMFPPAAELKELCHNGYSCWVQLQTKT